ncbi:MAG: hypothetical protein SLAVMIC_00856 [uncultured marine phage]|uniref:Uncharacterized protein n=1 Tax=uncultured marine phage TaxID=707152 RepID=A0A8D9CCU0_9VIRU|nr:MAG: hypothetical protein SLAVMIC_00856 [uncultured marine phage]
MIKENGNITYLLESGKEYNSLILKLTSDGYNWLIPPDFSTIKFPRILHADWNKTIMLYDVKENQDLYKKLYREKRISKMLDN